MVKNLKSYDYPIAGSLRIGEKNEKNVPVRLNYFTAHKDTHTDTTVVDIFNKVYHKPTKIKIRFLSSEPLEVDYLRYTKAGLQCKGDGEKANYRAANSKEWPECKCSEGCEYRGKECKLTGRLIFIIKDLNIGGVWRFQTQSYNTIQNFLTTLKFLKATGVDITERDFVLETEEGRAIVEGKVQKYTTVNLKMIDANFIEETTINEPKHDEVTETKKEVTKKKTKKEEIEKVESNSNNVVEESKETVNKNVNNDSLDDLEKSLTLVELKDVTISGKLTKQALFCSMQDDEVVEVLIHPDIVEKFEKLQPATMIIPLELYEKNNYKVLKDYKEYSNIN